MEMLDKYIIRFCIFLDNLIAPIDRIFENKKKKGKKKDGRTNTNK